MQRQKILELLEDDDQYYTGIGREFLSNSDIKTLQTNPLKLKEPRPNHVNFMIGKYLHTAILEPNKLKNFKIIESSTRNTKKYKEKNAIKKLEGTEEDNKKTLKNNKTKKVLKKPSTKNKELAPKEKINKKVTVRKKKIKEVKTGWWDQ